jgi:proton glutamate symport protein
MRLSFASVDYRRYPASATVFALGALALGFALGAATHRWQNPVLLAAVRVFTPIGQLWLSALLMITLPLVISLLMTVVVGAGHSRQAGKLSGYTLLCFVLMLLATGVGTVAAGSALVKWFPVDETTRAAMQSSIDPAANQAALRGGPSGSLKDWLVNLVPTNLVAALSSAEVLPAIVAGLLFALAIRGTAEEHRLLLARLLRAVSATTLTLAGYILRVLPLAVFALTFTTSAKAGPAIAGGVAYYVVAVTVLLVIATILLYPVTWWLGGVSPRRFAKGVLPSQGVAVASRSSLAALPSLLDRGQRNIGLPPSVATFVLPLATSVFKLNRTISSPLKVIILAHLYGVPVDSSLKLFFVFAATLLSFGSPGLPSGGQLVTLPFYLAAGLPIQGIVLLNAVDSIPDVFKTLLNVTADMSVATIVARVAGYRLAPVDAGSGPASVEAGPLAAGGQGG